MHPRINTMPKEATITPVNNPLSGYFVGPFLYKFAKSGVLGYGDTKIVPIAMKIIVLRILVVYDIFLTYKIFLINYIM